MREFPNVWINDLQETMRIASQRVLEGLEAGSNVLLGQVTNEKGCTCKRAAEVLPVIIFGGAEDYSNADVDGSPHISPLEVKHYHANRHEMYFPESLSQSSPAAAAAAPVLPTSKHRIDASTQADFHGIVSQGGFMQDQVAGGGGTRQPKNERGPVPAPPYRGERAGPACAKPLEDTSSAPRTSAAHGPFQYYADSVEDPLRVPSTIASAENKRKVPPAPWTLLARAQARGQPAQSEPTLGTQKEGPVRGESVPDAGTDVSARSASDGGRGPPADPPQAQPTDTVPDAANRASAPAEPAGGTTFDSFQEHGHDRSARSKLEEGTPLAPPSVANKPEPCRAPPAAAATGASAAGGLGAFMASAAEFVSSALTSSSTPQSTPDGSHHTGKPSAEPPRTAATPEPAKTRALASAPEPAPPAAMLPSAAATPVEKENQRPVRSDDAKQLASQGQREDLKASSRPAVPTSAATNPSGASSKGPRATSNSRDADSARGNGRVPADSRSVLSQSAGMNSTAAAALGSLGKGQAARRNNATGERTRGGDTSPGDSRSVLSQSTAMNSSAAAALGALGQSQAARRDGSSKDTHSAQRREGGAKPAAGASPVRDRRSGDGRSTLTMSSTTTSSAAAALGPLAASGGSTRRAGGSSGGAARSATAAREGGGPTPSRGGGGGGSSAGRGQREESKSVVSGLNSSSSASALLGPMMQQGGASKRRSGAH